MRVCFPACLCVRNLRRHIPEAQIKANSKSWRQEDSLTSTGLSTRYSRLLEIRTRTVLVSTTLGEHGKEWVVETRAFLMKHKIKKNSRPIPRRETVGQSGLQQNAAASSKPAGFFVQDFHKGSLVLLVPYAGDSTCWRDARYLHEVTPCYPLLTVQRSDTCSSVVIRCCLAGRCVGSRLDSTVFDVVHTGLYSVLLGCTPSCEDVITTRMYSVLY